MAEVLNTTQVYSRLIGFVVRVKKALFMPMLEVIILFLSAYILLLIVKVVLARLQRREILSATIVEQIYKLLSLLVYTIVGVSALYLITNANEIIYVLLIVLAAILFSNWKLIANITAYYVMLLQRQAYRGATLIELKNLGIKGKVLEINPMYTKLRTIGGRIVYIPNYVMIGEPVVHLVNVQTNIALRIEIDRPKEEQLQEAIRKIEKTIKSKLDEARIVVRVRDVTVRVLSAAPSRLNILVVAPIAGSEPRPATINNMVAVLLDALRGLNPRIEVENIL